MRKKIISILIISMFLVPFFVYAADVVTYNPPMKADINQFVGKLIKGVVGIVGSLALVMIIYSGFMWMSASGNAEKVNKAKTILIWSTLGLLVIFASYAIVNFIFGVTALN